MALNPKPREVKSWMFRLTLVVFGSHWVVQASELVLMGLGF